MADKKDKVILDFEVDSKDAVVNIEKLTQANKALREERKKVDLSTEEGIKRVKEINKAIDENDKVIKNNSSSLEKQRLNIGNYSSAIDRLIPGFENLSQAVGGSKTFIEGATKSIGGMSTATKVLLGPIGLVIAAISLFVSWLTRTEAGGDLLQKKIDQVQAVFGVLIDRATALGGALVKLFTGDFTGAVDDAKAAFTGVTAEIAKEVKIAGELADILDELEDRERSQKVALSASELQIKQLIVASKNRNLSEAEKIKLLEQANAIEVQNNKISKEIALDKLKAATAQLEIDFSQLGLTREKTESELEYAQRLVDNAEIEGTARDAVAEAIIALNSVEGESLVLQEKLANQIDAQNQKQEEKKKKLEELAAKQIELNEQIAISEQNKADKQKAANDKELADTLARIDAKEKAEMASLDFSDLLNDEQLKEIEEGEKKEVELATKAEEKKREERQKTFQMISEGINATVDLTNKLTDLFLGSIEVQKNQLALSLVDQKKSYDQYYSGLYASLKENLDKGLITQEEYEEKLKILKADEIQTRKDAETKYQKELDALQKKAFEAEKKNRIVVALAEGAQAVLSAFAQAFGGPILKGIAATAAAAFAAIQIDQIRKMEYVPKVFRSGGYTGAGNPDELAGLTHKNEFVIPSEVVNTFGKDHFQSYMDGSIVANASTSGVGGANMPNIKVYTSWKEFKDFEREMQTKAEIVEV